MRYANRFAIFVALLLSLAGSFGPEVVWAAPAEHVVVISLDGMAGYLVDDPAAFMPNIRRLVAEGVKAKGGMKVSNPSVTWPNHTTMVTGVQPRKHGVLANGVLVRKERAATELDSKRDKTELVRVPTVYDVAHAAHLKTAGVSWPCTRNADGLELCLPEVPEGLNYATPSVVKELTDAGILPEDGEKGLHHGQTYVWFDDLWTRAACHLIRHDKPNLLLMHLLLTDTLHHKYGPQTPAGYTADAYADVCVGRVLDAIDAAGIRDRTAVLIVADHGFTNTPQALMPNSLLRQEGYLKAVRPGKVDDVVAYCVPEGGVGLLYINDPAADAATRKKIRDLFVGKEGIVEVLEGDRFAEFGLPDVRDWPQMSDMVLVAKDGYGFAGTADEERWVAPAAAVGAYLGTHGFLNTDPKMNAIFVAAGAGLRKGVTLEGVENIDVAPTIAHLLGISLHNVDGKVLKEALADGGR